MKNLLRSLIVVLIFTAGIISNLHADVNVVINLKRPLPPSLSDWRNDPTLIQLTLTANQNYPQIRIAFTITNTDNNQEIAKTRDNSPAMPRFNLYANTPLMVTGPQIVREDALDLNSSIRETATTTQMLPEGNYEFCVRILDQNGAQITQTGASCRNSFITIPDPPQLISPLDITLPGAIPVLPQFLWAPVANPPRGVLISYLLKIAPLFQGQDIRTAIDNNPLLFNKLLQAGRTSYQYLPSDLPFSRYPDANGYVWQVQALDNQNKPITRNDGKSEIGKFFIGSDIRTQNEDVFRLIFPEDMSNINGAGTKFTWRSAGSGFSYKMIIAKQYEGESEEAALNNKANLHFQKILNDTVYEYSLDDPYFIDTNKTKTLVGFVWCVEAVGNKLEKKIQLNSKTSDIWQFTWISKVKVTGNETPNEIDCDIVPPTNNTLSQKNYKKDDNIKVGEFTMVLTEEPIKSGDLLKGSGYVTIPFLKNIHLAVQFTDGIKINTDDQVIDGVIQAKMLDGFPVVPSIGLDEKQIQKYTAKSSDNGQKMGSLTDYALVMLPVGIDNIVHSSPFVFAITSAQFSYNGAKIDAAMTFQLPGLEDGAILCFGGQACIKPEGFGDNKELYLAKEFIYPTSGDGWAFTFKRKMMNNKGTYISFDKDGFKELTVSAGVKFPRSWFVPMPDNDVSSQVEIDINAIYNESKDLVGSCSIPNFAPASFKDLQIEVKEMFVDLAASMNPSNMTFPKDYKGDPTNSWQGFYISKATLTLPGAFKSSKDAPLTGEIRNLIIDKSGFSGEAAILKLLDLNLGGFSASIDTFYVKFVNNSFTTGGVNGKLKLPISPDNLKYSGTMTKEQSGITYSFTVYTDSTTGLKVPMWLASFNLLSSSSFSIKYSPSGFTAEALINANITIDKQIGPLPVKLELMSVEGLKITQDGLQGGTFKLGSPQKSICGFDLSVASISLVSEGSDRYGLKFDIQSLQLYGDAFTGSTQFTIWGKKSRKSFSYDNYELNKVQVKSDLIPGLIKLDGELDLFNGDAIYGDGFRANIDAYILEKIHGTMTVQFGSKPKTGSSDRFKYWYVDASIVTEVGMPIGPGVGIYGFGGGAYHNMVQDKYVSSVPAKTDSADAKVLGATSSGAHYVPSEDPSMGFKAKVVFGTHPTAFPMNCELGMDLTFINNKDKNNNDHWSVDQITFDGTGYLCSRVTNHDTYLAQGKALLKMDFANKRFDGTISVNFNFATVSGEGTAYILVDKGNNKWHVYVGDWVNKITLSQSIPAKFDIDGYLMTGNDLPSGLPPYPSKIQEIFSECGKSLPAVKSEDKALYGEGKGIAFGGSASFDGNYQFLIFYAYLSTGIGFDFNFREYKGVTCKNSGDLGINSWYARGQFYAYVAASIGIHVDVWFFEGDMEILSGGFAAILEGGMPNPTWGKGAIAGYYRVLKGLVKGHCSFEFAFGNQCEFESENPLAMGLISDMQPSGNDISPFVSPTATFNFQIPNGNIEHPFEIQLVASDGMQGPVRTFKINMEEISLKEKNGGKVEFTPGVTDEDMTLALTPKAVLDGKTYEFKIRASGQELINGVWQPALCEKAPNIGKPIINDTTVTFTTTKAPDFVPDQNILYAFPARGQRYFIPDKSLLNTGYIVIRQDQSYLFNADELLDKMGNSDKKGSVDVNYFAMFKYDGTKKFEVPANYAAGPTRVEFDITQLLPNKVYNVQIVARITPKVNFANLTGLTLLQKKITERNQNGITLVSSSSQADKKKVSTAAVNEYINQTPSGDQDNTKIPTVNFDGKVKEKSVDDLKKNNNSGTVLNTDLMKKEDPAYNKKANTTNVKDQSISDASGKKYTSLADLNNNSTGDNVSKSKSKYNNIFSPNDVNYMDQDQAIIDTTSTRQIDVGVMKTLQSNEKLLFESDYFFRTSKFTSLTQKINSITYKSHTTPYGYLCYTHLNVQESFDNVDIAGTSYVSDKSENKIFGPFIQIFENENSDWFNNAINTVYNVYQGNLNISLPIVGDIGGIPYWQNDRYQGEADCKEGSYFFKYLSDDVTDLYKNTDRNKRLIDKTMFSTFGDPAFKTLNEAVAFVPTNTTMEVDYNGGYALSNDANNLFIKIMIEYFDLKGAVKIYWNQAYTCLYLICYGNDGQQAALDRYYQNLNMNQNDCFIAYNVYDYLWGSIDNYKKTHLNFYGDVGYIIKGWYPPGPAQYIPGTIVGWNKRGEKAITFHVD